MPHAIFKFRLSADAVVKNSVFGDEPARANILRTAEAAGVLKKNIRDRSNASKVEIDVILQSAEQRIHFQLACGADVDRII